MGALGALAVVATTTVIGVAVDQLPAAATAPAVDLWAPMSPNVSTKNGAQTGNASHIFALAMIQHDPGTTVDAVRFDLVHSTSSNANCGATQTVTCSGGYRASGGWNNVASRATALSMTVRELPGQAASTTSTNSNYSQVLINITPPNYDSWQNDGADGSVCGIEGNVRICRDTAAFSFRLSDGQTTADRTMTYWTTAATQSSGETDYPTSTASTSTTGSEVTAGSNNAVTIGFTCDDPDSSGEDACDSANMRFRRLGDNVLVNPGTSSDSNGVLTCALAGGSEGCETRSGPTDGIFNADDNNARTYTYRAPRSRGLYVIEAQFCNEGGACPGESTTTYNATTTTYGNPGSTWEMLGYFYVNNADPTVSFGTATQTGGGSVGSHPTTGALHPNTGATLTYNVTTSSDTQVVDWNLDQNASNGINASGYELRKYGDVSYSSSAGTPTLAADAKQQSIDLSAFGAGANCAAAVRVYDTGGVNATDPSAGTASASRTCTTNNLPAGTSQSAVNVQRGQATAIDLAVSDADRWSAGGNGGDEAPSISLTQPAIGSVTCGAFVPVTTTTGRFPCSYSVPANTAPGSYSYSYTVTDSHAGTSATRTVTGSIVNTAPVATGSTRPIQRGATSTFNLVASDANGDTIDGSVAGSGFSVVSTAGMPAGSTVNCTSAGACTVSIAPNTALGNASFTWTAADNAATSNTATETIAVANTAPVAHAVTENGVQRGRPATEAAFDLAADDANGDTLTYTVGASSLPTGSTLTCSGTGACTVAVPADTPLGDYTFSYTASDGSATSNSATVTVGVGNTAPVANPVGLLHTTVGASLPVALDGTDFNGDTLTYAAPVTGPTKGGVSGSGASVTYVAANGTKGADSFTYTVSDNAPSTSSAGTVSIEIDNTAPTAAGQEVSAPRQVATGITLGGSDVNGDDLTFSVDTNVTKGVLDCDPDGTCSYTAGPGETGDDSFTFVANDGTANSTTATVTIHITNTAPTANDQAVDAARHVPTGITLTGSDENGDPLGFDGPVTEPTKGSVTCDEAGACTYTSDLGVSGDDSFTFSVDDGFGGTDTATVTIHITNTEPVAADQSVDAPRRVATPIQLGASDANGDAITFTGPVTGPTKGSVTCDGDGACSYTSGVGQTGTDSFTFSVDDGFGGTDTGTVTVTLTNSAPSAGSHSYVVTKGIPKTFTLQGVDPNEDTLTYAVVDQPDNGTVTCDGDGTCTYVATATTGSDAFTYTASDGFGGTSDEATISFDIRLPRVSVGEAQVLEPDDANQGVFVPLTLSAPLPVGVTVSYYTVDGTATSTGTSPDYLAWGTPAKPRTVTIAAGKTWTPISPPIKTDDTTEPTETFEVHIVSAVGSDGSEIPMGESVATVSIIDNYRAADDPLLAVQDSWAYEGDAQSGTKGQFVIQFSKHVDAPFVLQYATTTGTATAAKAFAAGKDWKGPLTGSITITPTSALYQVIDVPFFGDTVTEENETVNLQVLLPDGVHVIQKKPNATVTILNDD